MPVQNPNTGDGTTANPEAEETTAPAIEEEDEDDILIVVDETPATRQTLKQQLMVAAISERCVERTNGQLILNCIYWDSIYNLFPFRLDRKNQKGTWRLEDEEQFDDEELFQEEVEEGFGEEEEEMGENAEEMEVEAEGEEEEEEEEEGDDEDDDDDDEGSDDNEEETVEVLKAMDTDEDELASPPMLAVHNMMKDTSTMVEDTVGTPGITPNQRLRGTEVRKQSL